MVALSLEGDNGVIAGLVDDDGWCQLSLVQSGGTIALGAETARHMAQRLLSWLIAPCKHPAGEIAGKTVFWIMNLPELHYTLYSVLEGDDLLILFQNPDTRILGTLRLKPSHQLEWSEKLAGLLANSET